MTDVLTESARRAPVLLVLEDVHWADAPTLLLLRHLVRSAADARLLLVATFRDSVDEVTPGLADALVDVSRTEGVIRIRLGGLTSDEVGEFVRLAAGTAPTAELTSTLAELTGGNAFLLTELWRELVESGGIVARPGGVVSVRPAGDVAAPTTVREMVGQRVSRLEPETTAVLELAAVAGAGFELETIRHASGLPDEALLAAVDGAVQSGLVVEESGPVLAYRFEHELVRRAVADRLSAARRAETHLRVAEALEQTAPHGDSRARLSALAHHYASAAGVGGRERAVSYNLLAAESAVAALAFEEAAARFSTALELGLAEPRERAETLLQLGDAARRAGDVEVAIGAFGDVAELARRLGDAELLARAAIEYEEACWRPAIHDDAAAVGLLREAATALGAGDSELHARLLGGLARALDLRGDPAPAARARDASIAMSRRRDDRRTLATTLAQSYWAQGSSSQTAVNAMLREARELGRALGDPDLEAEASSWLVPSYVVLCDHESARAQLAELLLLVQRSNEPFFLHVAEHYRAALALCDGDLDAAERGAIQSRDWGMLLTGRDASGPYGIQMFGIRREQGRLAELAPAVRLLDARTRDGAWRPGLAVVLAELGMADEARAALHHVLDDGLGALRSSLWIASLVYMADAAALLDDRDAAAVLYPELATHVGENVMVGHLVACYGAMDRYLGMTATVLGDWERAEAHFQTALALNTRLGARTWLAHTAYWYARMLLARGRAEDADLLRSHLALAGGLARAIGLPTLLARASELGAPEPEADELPDGLSAREVEILVELARGRSNREIGRLLHISEHTAANHVRSILRKTQSANRTEAAGYAMRRGLVPD